MKFSFWWVTAALWLMLVAPSAAQQRVVVLPFEGPASGPVRKHVVVALQKRSEVELVAERDAQAAFARSGEPEGYPEAYVAAGRELGVAAFVEGEVTRAKGRFIATIRVRDASTGQVTRTEPYPRKKPAQFKSIRGNFWRVFGSAIESASAPQGQAEPEPEPEPVPMPMDDEPEPAPEPMAMDDAPEPERAPRKREPGARSALEFDVLPGLLWRDLNYNDADANLRNYSSNGPAFIVGGELEWFPGAHFTDSRWGDIGIEVGGDAAVGLTSDDGTGPVSTSVWDLAGGAVFRIPVDMFTPAVRVGYVKQVFDVAVDQDTVFLPSMNYSALRFGVGCGVRVIEQLELEVALAYLHVLDAGQVNGPRYFPRGTAGAIDLESSVVYYFLPYMGVVTGVDFRRYGHDFKPDPSFAQRGGTKIAGGAIDRYIKLDFGLRFRLSGE